MNFWAFNVILSTLLWSFFYDQTLLCIYLLFTALYLTMYIIYGTFSITTIRKKIAISTWNDSGDPSIFVKIQVDLTHVDQCLEDYNSKHPDDKLTYTVVFARALGEAMWSDRKACGKLSFSRYIPFDSVDLSVLVNINGDNLGAVLLRGCHKNSLVELNTQLKGMVKKTKTGQNAEFNHQLRVLRYIPTFVIQIFVRLITFLSYDLGLTLSFLRVKKNNFGVGILTNVTAMNS